MPDRAEHRAAMQKLSRERTAAGRPVWEYTVNLSGVFHSESMDFTQRRDAIVTILRASTWFKAKQTQFDDLELLVEELAETQTTAEFDLVWAEIYAVADDDRVWIETRLSGPPTST